MSVVSSFALPWTIRRWTRANAQKVIMVRFADESTSPPKTASAYRFVSDGHERWLPADSPSASVFATTELQLITWNIDAGADFPQKRFTRAMLHLRKEVFGDCNNPPPCCILLQEVHQDVLPALLQSAWIRNYFLVMPITTDGWLTPYGVVTLVSKTVPVSTVFVIELAMTTVGRQALFVDVHLSAPPPEAEDEKRDKRIRTIRIANTHLEPEPSGRRVRPKQLKQIARMLNVPNLDAYICAGSMCSVCDSDKAATSEAGFADACKGWNRDSMTWGYHPRTEQPPCRLDKILYFPTERVEISCPTRIGLRARISADGTYISDHCGISAMVKILRDH